METKTLKFQPQLADLILKGKKTTTWRLFHDEKGIKVGDALTLLRHPGLRPFANAIVIDVSTKLMGDLNENDLEGHEKFNSKKEMYEVYSKYYGEEVTLQTPVKIIKFEIR